MDELHFGGRVRNKIYYLLSNALPLFLNIICIIILYYSNEKKNVGVIDCFLRPLINELKLESIQTKNKRNYSI